MDAAVPGLLLNLIRFNGNLLPDSGLFAFFSPDVEDFLFSPPSVVILYPADVFQCYCVATYLLVTETTELILNFFMPVELLPIDAIESYFPMLSLMEPAPFYSVEALELSGRGRS